MAGTTATTAAWQSSFSVPTSVPGPFLGGGEIRVDASATWLWNPGSTHEMHLITDITGSYGCPGSETPFNVPVPMAGDGGWMINKNSADIAYLGTPTCPAGSVPTATFTVQAALSPGG
ncbi:MAG: hypothetical protein ACYCZN_12110 [Candidatus Dormibacteria bacterium]